LCLQETKMQDENFPVDEILDVGYRPIYSGQKAYNGVALLGKEMGKDLVVAIPNFPDPQKRVLCATYAGIRIICIYVPNGQSIESDKFQYKLNWLTALNNWLQAELIKYPKLILLGDFNIAPQDSDVHDPELWKGKVLCSTPERKAFKDLLELGLVDSFHLFDHSDKYYTWWDYRMMAFRRNKGMRIDHILLSNKLSDNCNNFIIDKEPRKHERPSDHAPVMVDFSI